ncbi:NAD-dependent epimerase/dehydratase family protein [Acinetobacter sp. ANC 4282]|nr:NAD-dependent epimerase/dehydratase family protein [Acinetobacter terrae]
MAKILVTGGLYWSHTCVELLNSGHEVAVLDNLCNSSEQSLNRVQALTEKTPAFGEGDIRDAQVFDQAF